MQRCTREPFAGPGPGRALQRMLPLEPLEPRRVVAVTVSRSAVTAKAGPARAVSARAVPTRAVPARAVPARAVPANIAPPPPPGLAAPLVAPTNVRAVATAANRVRLTWTDGSRNETGFVVERWQDGRSWVRVATTAANATSFTDATVLPGTRYAYRVRAVVASAAGTRLSAATVIVWVRTPLRVRAG